MTYLMTTQNATGWEDSLPARRTRARFMGVGKFS